MASSSAMAETRPRLTVALSGRNFASPDATLTSWFARLRSSRAVLVSPPGVGAACAFCARFARSMRLGLLSFGPRIALILPGSGLARLFFEPLNDLLQVL